MLEKSRHAAFFQWFACRVSRKVGLLKRRVRRSVLRGEIKNCTPLWQKTHFEVKMLKNWRCRSTFWSSDVAKLHGAVAKSTLWSQNVQNMRCSEHFLKFRCRKIARRCGEKHIGKWKCTKHVSFGALFEVQMSKNGTPLWRKAHWEVKMYKTRQFRSTFWSSDVEKLYAALAKSTFGSQNVKNCSPRGTFWSSDVEKLHAAVARSTFRSQNVKRRRFSEHFLRFWCRKISQVVS